MDLYEKQKKFVLTQNLNEDIKLFEHVELIKK